MKKIFLLFLTILIIFSTQSLAFSKTGHIYLLAVSESEDGNETGSIADLYLEIKEGQGRIFLDTVPLTKIDTQFSTRFANQMACEYLEIDCKKYDFFYTIQSRSSIVGGPSAGAAITILTITTLSDKKIPKELAITGTINAGGIIGPVGGVSAKLKAAENAGLKKVIIPSIEIKNEKNKINFTNETNINETKINLTDLLIPNITLTETKNSNIEIIKASNIDEAIYLLTGEKRKPLENLSVDKKFLTIMGEISKTLCDATEKLIVNGTNTSEEKKGNELYERSKNASMKGEFYASASYCFGANVQYRRLDLKNKTQDDLKFILEKITHDIENFEKNIDDKEIKTIDDLQTYMIVKERIIEAKEYVKSFNLEKNNTNISSDALAYTIERYNSALTWSKFFGSGNKEYNIDQESLKYACLNKISEVQSYLQYISVYLDTPLSNTNKILDLATTHLSDGDYELCISEATKAKAETYLVLEALSISHEHMVDTLPEKFDAAKQNIIKAQSKGVFPILGYSYYEYAKSLNEFDKDSSLVYAIYSIEMSNLDSYFEKKVEKQKKEIDYKSILLVSAGYLIGVISTLVAFRKEIFSKKNKKRR